VVNIVVVDVGVDGDETAVDVDDGFVDVGVEVVEVDVDVFVVVLDEEDVKDVKGVADDAVVGKEIVEAFVVDVVDASG
jgi:hypothetical protein